MKRFTYRKSGVDINKANKLIDNIKPMIAMTKRKGWMDNIGAFCGFFKPDLSQYKDPVLIASTDGVGTKLMIAQWANRHDTIGIDLVAMCVNDLITCGAEPLFFLDYFASGKLKPKVMRDVIKGIVEGCRLADTALIGGETAELPGMYNEGIYDIAGFSVGIADRANIIDGSRIGEGDLILGVQSSGLHSNGYSMVRNIFSRKELTGSLRSEVLKPTFIYVRPVREVIKNIDVKGIANITGGGFFDNIIRILPHKKVAVIFKHAWQIPDVFVTMKNRGNISDEEMYKTFNMGIGLVMIVSKKTAWKARRILFEKFKLDSWLIGEVINGKRRVELIDS